MCPAGRGIYEARMRWRPLMSKRRVDRHASEIGVGHTAGHVKMLDGADPASVEVDPKLAGQSLVDGCHPGARDAQDPSLLSPPVGT